MHDYQPPLIQFICSSLTRALSFMFVLIQIYLPERASISFFFFYFVVNLIHDDMRVWFLKLTSSLCSLASNLSWFSNFFCLILASVTMQNRRALIWAWILLQECIQFNVLESCSCTGCPRVRTWNLTTPFSRDNVLLACQQGKMTRKELRILRWVSCDHNFGYYKGTNIPDMLGMPFES